MTLDQACHKLQPEEDDVALQMDEGDVLERAKIGQQSREAP